MASANAIKRLPQHLKELRIHLCQRSPSSQGVREWVEKYYVDMKKANPKFPILIRECSNVNPVVHARYVMNSRTRSRRKPPEVDEALEYINIKDREGFCVQLVENKGRGVFTTEAFTKGQFLMQYYGKLCSWEEGDILEEQNSTGYRFFFKFRGETYCIDATKEATEGPMLGRLVNHGEKKERNTKLQIVNFHGTPALCLYALRNIKRGEELLYDYGVANLPWKKKSPDEPEKNDSSKAEINEDQCYDSDNESEETEEDDDHPLSEPLEAEFGRESSAALFNLNSQQVNQTIQEMANKKLE